jgi:hypothetical protein
MRHQVLAASSASLNARPRKMVREVQFLVRMVRWRTVAKVDSIGGAAADRRYPFEKHILREICLRYCIRIGNCNPSRCLFPFPPRASYLASSSVDHSDAL